MGGGRNTCSRGRRDHLHLPVGDVRRGDTPIPLGCTWTIHALAPNNRTGVPMTGNFQRRRPLVSFLVSKSFGNQESSPVLEREVGVSRKDQPISCFMTFSVRRRSSIWESVSKFHDRLPQGQSIWQSKSPLSGRAGRHQVPPAREIPPHCRNPLLVRWSDR